MRRTVLMENVHGKIYLLAKGKLTKVKKIILALREINRYRAK